MLYEIFKINTYIDVLYMYVSYRTNSEWKSKNLQINTVYRTIISMFSR